jgi:hypothetical protein
MPDLTMCRRVGGQACPSASSKLAPFAPSRKERLNELAGEHGDATLLVNAAGLFLPKPFLDHDGADYDYDS